MMKLFATLTICAALAFGSTNVFVETIPTGGVPGLPFVPGFSGATEVLITTDDPGITGFTVTAVTSDGEFLSEIAMVNRGFASVVFDTPHLLGQPHVTPIRPISAPSSKHKSRP